MEIWFRPPQVVRGVLYAAGGFTFAFLALLAWDFDHLYNGYDVDRLVGWAALAALIGLLLTSWFLGVEDSLRRSFGSIEQYITYNRAWRTGELPARIDPDAWRGWLYLSRLSSGMARLLAFAVLLLVVVPSLIYRPAYHPVAASLLGLLAIWRLVFSWRKRARITRLAAEVERHAEVEPHAEGQMTHEQAAFETYFQGSFSVRSLDVVVVGFSLAFVVAYVDRLYNGDDGSLVWLLVWAAFFGVVPAMFMMVGNERRLRRNFGSVDQYAAYTQALKTGELPARIDPVVWRAWLRRSRRLKRMGPLWLFLLVAFGLLPSLISQSAYWVTATASGLLTLSNLFGWWRRRGKIARLAAEVERHAPRGSTV